MMSWQQQATFFPSTQFPGLSERWNFSMLLISPIASVIKVSRVNFRFNSNDFSLGLNKRHLFGHKRQNGKVFPYVSSFENTFAGFLGQMSGKQEVMQKHLRDEFRVEIKNGIVYSVFFAVDKSLAFVKPSKLLRNSSFTCSSFSWTLRGSHSRDNKSYVETFIVVEQLRNLWVKTFSPEINKLHNIKNTLFVWRKKSGNKIIRSKKY